MKYINKHKEEYSLKDKIITIIFLAWFIGSMVGMLVLSEINEYYTIMIFGQYFLVFSLIMLWNKIIAGIPFFLVGSACLVVPYLMMKPEINGRVIIWDDIVPILIISVFVIVGLGLIIYPLIDTIKAKLKRNTKVTAIVKEYATMDKYGNPLYYPLYEFEYNGQTHKVIGKKGYKKELKNIGTFVDLKINPNNPSDLFNNYIVTYIPIIMGIMFLLISVPSLILVLSNAKFIE